MGNLRDQLKKARLLSKKDAKRLAHEERVHHQQIGGAKASDHAKAEHQESLARKRAAQAEEDRQRERQQQALRDADAERAACEELLRREVRSPGRQGAARWYFCLADGRIPRLDLPMADRQQLQGGEVCLVRRGLADSHDYGLMSIEFGRRIAAVFPERVVWAAAGSGVRFGELVGLTMDHVSLDRCELRVSRAVSLERGDSPPSALDRAPRRPVGVGINHLIEQSGRPATSRHPTMRSLSFVAGRTLPRS
jgi:uncharacterized protein YaiL (DUF2058 family)